MSFVLLFRDLCQSFQSWLPSCFSSIALIAAADALAVSRASRMNFASLLAHRFRLARTFSCDTSHFKYGLSHSAIVLPLFLPKSRIIGCSSLQVCVMIYFDSLESFFAFIASRFSIQLAVRASLFPVSLSVSLIRLCHRKNWKSRAFDTNFLKYLETRRNWWKARETLTI